MRGFTVGFSAALACVLWSGAGTVLVFAFLVLLGLLSLKVHQRCWSLSVGLCVGVVLAHWCLFHQISRQFSSTEIQTDYLLIGTVLSAPEKDARRIRFEFQIDRFVGQQPKSRPKRILLSWYGGAEHAVRAGDQWRLLARLKPPASLGNPGGFNYARWLFQNRIHATGYVRDSPVPFLLKSQPNRLTARRESIAEHIQTLPDANENAALVQGLTVGMTNRISTEQWQTLRHTGTAHLMAISGLHIGLISGWFYLLAAGIWWLVSKITSGYSHRWCTKPVFCVVVSLLGAYVYAALAGFSLPTQRALIMLCVVACASVFRRVWPPGSALLLALLLVLLIEPLTVLSVGFWLSFGTVSAIFYLYNGRLHKRQKFNKLLGVHLKLSIVLLPASAWFFQQGAILAPLANVIAVPVVGLVVVPISFIVALFSTSSPALANVLLIAVQWLLDYLFVFLDWLLSWPAANVSLFLTGPLLFLCVLVGCFVLFVPRGLGLRWLSVPLLAPAIVLNVLGRPVQGLEMHVLDVGQGLSAVLFTSGHTVLFDTGRSASHGASMVERVVKPFLVSQGRSTVDVSIVSHGDDDHAGGLDALLDLYPRTSLYSGDRTHQSEHGANACLAGRSFVLDGVTFSFLHPGMNDAGSDNNLSCVLLVHFGDTRILLTGDIESESEKLLINRIEKAFPVTVMVAPHHGSRTSSTPDFVSLFAPKNVIFAAGTRNAYGFPHAEVEARYEQLGATPYTTGTGGAISMRFDQSGLRLPVDQYWSSHRRY